MKPLSRAARGLAMAALAAALAGCAGAPHYPAMPSPEALPPGSPLRSRTLGQTDAWLRWYLMTGRADSAATLLQKKGVAPRDELLRRLQLGVVMHQAGRWEESNAAFEWAEHAADDRYARSVRQ
ncbi:MAG TPA: hypothetical protein VFH27_02055, partial [Longimicrobiaceae bacterium]|nr:hypothetical protein [Longimicrobiaceae bacterium]